MAKILHISKYYFPFPGGLEDVCKSLVEGIPEHEQRVLCFNTTAESVTERVGQTLVYRIGLWREVARQPIGIGLFSTMKDVLQTYDPDIVHFHAPNPLAAALLLTLLPRTTRLVLHWHSDIIVQPLLHRVIAPFEQRLLRRADTILATSPNYIEGSPFLKAHRDKCTVLPNIVSCHKLAQRPKSGLTPEALHDRYGAHLVMFIGRHVGYKGIDRLIEAAQFLPDDIHILIGGRGPESVRLETQAQGRRNITFVGKIPDDEIMTYFQASEVFAFPSITKNEAFGVVLAEAMYAGLVPVTFDIEGSGVNWVSLRDTTGLQVPNSDCRAYAAAIERLVRDTELRTRLSQAARQRANKHFTLPAIHDTVIEVYHRLLNTPTIAS